MLAHRAGSFLFSVPLIIIRIIIIRNNLTIIKILVGHLQQILGGISLNVTDNQRVLAVLSQGKQQGTEIRITSDQHIAANVGILKNQLHTSGFQRTYLAICQGVPQPPAGVIDAPIGPKPGSLMEQMVRADGKPARTHYRTLSVHSGRALVELRLDTGRTHQIRVHMAHIGHPLLGDFLYGQEDRELIPRSALHSVRLALRHPITGQEMTFTAPLPEDMRHLL